MTVFQKLTNTETTHGAFVFADVCHDPLFDVVVLIKHPVRQPLEQIGISSMLILTRATCFTCVCVCVLIGKIERSERATKYRERDNVAAT